MPFLCSNHAVSTIKSRVKKGERAGATQQVSSKIVYVLDPKENIRYSSRTCLRLAWELAALLGTWFCLRWKESMEGNVMGTLYVLIMRMSEWRLFGIPRTVDCKDQLSNRQMSCSWHSTKCGEGQYFQDIPEVWLAIPVESIRGWSPDHPVVIKAECANAMLRIACHLHPRFPAFSPSCKKSPWESPCCHSFSWSKSIKISILHWTSPYFCHIFLWWTSPDFSMVKSHKSPESGHEPAELGRELERRVPRGWGEIPWDSSPLVIQ